jgi:hypothetical protein
MSTLIYHSLIFELLDQDRTVPELLQKFPILTRLVARLHLPGRRLQPPLGSTPQTKTLATADQGSAARL